MSAQNLYAALGTKKTPCRILFLMTLALYVVAIPFSKFMMSLAGVILVANWFLEGFLEKNLWKKVTHAAQSKMLWVILLVYFVHLLWFLSTENFTYAFKDIWLKVPLFFIPIIFYTSKPLNRDEMTALLQMYVLGVVFSSLFGYFTWLHHAGDKRTMAVYISYVRFELNICFAVFVSVYLLLQQNRRKYIRVFTVFALVWFLFLLVFAGLMTGIVLLIVISFLLVIRAAVTEKNPLIRYLLPAVFTLALGGISSVIYIFVKNYQTAPPFDSTKVEYTADGNAYLSDFNTDCIENGNYVYAYFCESELQQAWNNRSQKDYSEVHKTLVRYLNSKGLRKDRLAVESLTGKEIGWIENGIANIGYTRKFSIVRRMYELLWEINDYRQTGTMVGYSFAQRLELWKISLSAIKRHPLLGTGTGDVRAAFAQELITKGSPLAFTNKRSHNQCFTFLIAFGIVGLGLILFSIFYPVIVFGKLKDPLFLIFFTIVILSLFTEDTLEQQDGVTFFAFFYSSFLFLFPKRELSIENSIFANNKYLNE